jgi:hypothetical protein
MKRISRKMRKVQLRPAISPTVSRRASIMPATATPTCRSGKRRAARSWWDPRWRSAPRSRRQEPACSTATPIRRPPSPPGRAHYGCIPASAAALWPAAPFGSRGRGRSVLGLAGSFALALPFALAVCLYVALTASYPMALKRQMLPAAIIFTRWHPIRHQERAQKPLRQAGEKITLAIKVHVDAVRHAIARSGLRQLLDFDR